jgi:hypothetical protein
VYISISGESIRFIGYSFVDDADLILQTAETPQDTEQEVAEEMQRALNMWEGAIRATGGVIVPPRVFGTYSDFCGSSRDVGHTRMR